MMRVFATRKTTSAFPDRRRYNTRPKRAAFAFAARVLASAVLILAHTGIGASAQTNAELQDLVAGHMRPWLADGTGVAVVVRRFLWPLQGGPESIEQLIMQSNHQAPEP